MTADAMAPYAVRALFEPKAIGQLLQANLHLDWQHLGAPRDVRVERYWPVGDTGLSLEWSFRLGDAVRRTVYGSYAPGSDGPAPARFGPVAPSLLPDGSLRGVDVTVPDQCLILHSPDRDRGLAHLSTCLDGAAMADRLGSLTVRGAGQSDPIRSGLDCRLLGYRAGRRAAIRYQTIDSGKPPSTLLGKTYRDDRGRELIGRHARLNDRLVRHRGNRVRVPAPLRYDPELRMALLTWAGPGNNEPYSSRESLLHESVEALWALHRTDLDGLETFTAADECRIVERWHRMLGRVDRPVGVILEPLVKGLIGLGQSFKAPGGSTIHRDFYPKQWLQGPGTITVLDLDTLATGSVCVDLGNFLAHLLLAWHQQNESTEDWGSQAEWFLHRYEAGCGVVDRHELAFYFCTALFRLGAVHAFRATTGRWAPRLWQAAADQLSAGLFEAARWKPRAEHPAEVSAIGAL